MDWSVGYALLDCILHGLCCLHHHICSTRMIELLAAGCRGRGWSWVCCIRIPGHHRKRRVCQVALEVGELLHVLYGRNRFGA